MKCIRTNSKNIDFIDLVRQLDLDLAVRDGDDHTFYNQFNGIENIDNVVLILENQKPIGCGAFKVYEGKTVEIKRMFTLPESRGKGIATKVLELLEEWAHELDFTSMILETGVMQPEAIQLYKKNNYKVIENYGVYNGVKTSVCFQKNIELL